MHAFEILTIIVSWAVCNALASWFVFRNHLWLKSIISHTASSPFHVKRIASSIHSAFSEHLSLIFLVFVALSDWWLVSHWEFVLTHPSLVLVFIGVVGEIACDFPKEKFHKLEKFSGLILIIGLFCEFSETIKTDSDIVKANGLAADTQLFSARLGTTNAQLVAANLLLQSNVLELEKQVLTLVEKTKIRNVSQRARTDLASELKQVPKGSVEIIMSDRDAECLAFGLEIKKTLIAAGFPNVNFSPRDIFRAIEIFPEAANSGTDLLFCVKNSSSPPLCSVLTLNRLKTDGLNASGWPYLDSLPANDFQIWILPKPVHPEK